jgi:hypothetical protein
MQTEWIEMPRLKLTRPQAQRLWTLPNEVCDTAFETLVQRGFLVQAPDGTYIRQAFLRAGAIAAARPGH